MYDNREVFHFSKRNYIVTLQTACSVQTLHSSMKKPKDFPFTSERSSLVLQRIQSGSKWVLDPVHKKFSVHDFLEPCGLLIPANFDTLRLYSCFEKTMLRESSMTLWLQVRNAGFLLRFGATEILLVPRLSVAGWISSMFPAR